MQSVQEYGTPTPHILQPAYVHLAPDCHNKHYTVINLVIHHHSRSSSFINQTINSNRLHFTPLYMCKESVLKTVERIDVGY